MASNPVNDKMSNLHHSEPQESALIQCLPPELLSKIFLHLRRIWISNHKPKKRVSWLVITQVCRTWRDVAYDTAALWSHISSEYPQNIVDEWLQRSKSVPLVVEWLSPFTPTPITPPISRIRRSKVVLLAEDWKELHPWLSRPADLLESLSLCVGDIDANLSEDSSLRPLESFFAGTTPRLRHLSINGGGVDSSSSLLTNLAILEIRNPNPPFSPSAFLPVLHRLPRLISLQISGVLRLPIDIMSNPIFVHLPPDVGIVRLPSIDLLSMHGLCFDQDIDFLSHLSFPSTTTLLFATGFPFHSSPIPALNKFLRVHTSARQDYKTFTPTSIEILTFSGRLKLTIKEGDKTLFCTKFDSQYGDGNQRQIAGDAESQELLAHLTSPTITSFSTNGSISPTVWPIVSSSFPCLESLSVKGYCDDDETILTSMILDARDRSESLLSWTPIFPRLEQLFLEQLKLDSDLTEIIVQTLRDRSAAYSVLELVDIKCCFGVTKGLVDSLRSVKGLSVNWDEWDDEEDVFDVYEEVCNALEWNRERGEITLGVEEKLDMERYYVDSYMVDDT